MNINLHCDEEAIVKTTKLIGPALVQRAQRARCGRDTKRRTQQRWCHVGQRVPLLKIFVPFQSWKTSVYGQKEMWKTIFEAYS